MQSGRIVKLTTVQEPRVGFLRCKPLPEGDAGVRGADEFGGLYFHVFILIHDLAGSGLVAHATAAPMGRERQMAGQHACERDGHIGVGLFFRS